MVTAAADSWALELDGVSKTFPGQERSLRGTKLETQGPVLWARNLGRALRLTSTHQPPVSALQEVTLRIRAGEVFGLLGANGAGKTTLIKIMAGLLRPSLGAGTVAGCPLSRPEAIRQRVSYVSTTGWMGLEWALTALENVVFFGSLCGMTRHQARSRAEAAIRDVGLWADRDKRTAALSNGMRQRVILARALLFRTPIVLLDEPTVGLDPITRDLVLTLIAEVLPARGQTVIIADHQTSALQSIVHRVAILAQGRLVALGAPDELLGPLRGTKILELVTRGGDTPLDPMPPAVFGLTRTPRPGPLGLTEWRVAVHEHTDAVHETLFWVYRSGANIVQATERAPTIRDLVEHGLVPAGTGALP